MFTTDHERRLKLQELLESLASNVYFQPPPNVQMQYPCIVYSRDPATTQFADNLPYRFAQRYQVTVIDVDPDSLIPGKVAALPTAAHRRFFATKNLNHDVFNIYF